MIFTVNLIIFLKMFKCLNNGTPSFLTGEGGALQSTSGVEVVQQGPAQVVYRLRPRQARLRGRGGGGDDDVWRRTGDSVSPPTPLPTGHRTSASASGEHRG